MSADMRAAIAAAMDETDDELEPTPPDEGGEGEGEPTGEPTPPPEPEGEVPEGKVRDALGRFVNKNNEPAASKQLEGEVPSTPAPEERAPASWSPAAREEWKAIGATARAEVMRREQEVQRTLYESAQARQMMGQLSETLTPYMARIQSAGVPPMQMIGNLLNTEAGLATGTPVQRAQIVANLVKQYGVDIQTLDSALAGAPIEASPDTAIQHTVQSLLQRELAPFHQMMQTAQQRQQQAAQEAQQVANQETEAFGQDPKNEFFGDVREEMADLIEVANRRGYQMSLGDAYQQALQLSPKVREVIQMRQQRQTALGASSVARRARAASVSISGAPVNEGSGTPPEDLRGALEAAWEATTRR